MKVLDPPDTPLIVMDALFKLLVELQPNSVTVGVGTTITAGSVTEMAAVATQPLPEITSTVYLPAAKPEKILESWKFTPSILYL